MTGRDALNRVVQRARESAVSVEIAVAFIVPAALVLSLAMSNGGYGVEARSLAGVASWAIVAVGCLLNVRPLSGVPKASALAFILLAAFAGWTALSFAWTENDERTAVEVGRVLTYLGVFVLAIGLRGAGNARYVLAGVTTALTVVCGIALMSRLEPNWFPERRSAEFIPVPEIERRLAYPLNYSGGIASLVTITLPLLMLYAWSARSTITRVIAAAALPMAILTLWLTSSGLLVAVSWVGLFVFVLLSQDRLPKLATLAAAVGAGGLLSFAVVKFPALDRGLPTPDALKEGDQLLVLTLIAMAAVGFAHFRILRLSERLSRPAWTKRTYNRRRILAGLAGAAALVVTVLALTGALDSQFDRFRSLSNVPPHESRVSQIADIGSSGRYQQWRATLDAASAEPLTGIGPGTFEFWWSRNGFYGGFVRDAHSLYLETLAELGAVGLLLIGGFIALILFCGVRRALAEQGETRVMRAGLVGALAAFAATAAVEWIWEIGVLPVAFVLLAALVVSPLGGSDSPADEAEPGARHRFGPAKAGLGVIALGLVSIFLIARPLIAERQIESSQEQFRAQDFSAAYESAVDAEGTEPYASTPRLQQALVLEQTGQIEEAIASAEEAVSRAPTDWRPLLILSRLQAADGDAEQSALSYERARSLNPLSAIFAE